MSVHVSITNDNGENRSGARHKNLLHKSDTELTEISAYQDVIDSNNHCSDADSCVESNLPVLMDEGMHNDYI